MARRGQTKKMSLIESGFNIIVGFTIAMIAQAVIFPAYGIHVSPSAHFQIGFWFTLVSLLRSYWLRRFFNWLDSK